MKINEVAPLLRKKLEDYIARCEAEIPDDDYGTFTSHLGKEYDTVEQAINDGKDLWELDFAYWDPEA